MSRIHVFRFPLLPKLDRQRLELFAQKLGDRETHNEKPDRRRETIPAAKAMARMSQTTM
jgi:hypothetical protein